MTNFDPATVGGKNGWKKNLLKVALMYICIMDQITPLTHQV